MTVFDRRFMAIVASAALAGCAQDAAVVAPPTYPPMSDADSLALIADRQARLTSISSECDLELTDANGQRVNLDGALAAEPPGNVRLRAWKLNQAVFDLTLRDGKGWILLPESGPAAGKVDADKMPARRVSEAFDLMGAGFFRRARVVGSTPTTITASAPVGGMGEVVCEIDRATLTARRFFHTGADPAAPELELDRYSLVEAEPPLVYPLLLRFLSRDGVVVVRCRTLELNGQIPPGAFTPPQRAKPLP